MPSYTIIIIIINIFIIIMDREHRVILVMTTLIQSIHSWEKLYKLIDMKYTSIKCIGSDI